MKLADVDALERNLFEDWRSFLFREFPYKDIFTINDIRRLITNEALAPTVNARIVQKVRLEDTGGGVYVCNGCGGKMRKIRLVHSRETAKIKFKFCPYCGGEVEK